ncbi:unnamed protein product [Urochloa humidicola]
MAEPGAGGASRYPPSLGRRAAPSGGRQVGHPTAHAEAARPIPGRPRVPNISLPSSAAATRFGIGGGRRARMGLGPAVSVSLSGRPRPLPPRCHRSRSSLLLLGSPARGSAQEAHGVSTKTLPI